MPTALITGGCGYIGMNWAQRLAQSARFDRVVLADIRPPTDPLPEGIEFLRCDVRNPIDFEVRDLEWVFNFAATHREPGHTPEEYLNTNFTGARNVCAFAEQVGCSNILFTSSIAVYGNPLKPLRESSPLCPTSPYGISKLCAELIHEMWWRNRPGRRLCICRPGVIYGPRDPGNILRMIRAVRRGYFVFPGSRDLRKSYGYIEGLLDSFEFVMARDEQQLTFNYAEKETESLETLVETIKTFVGKKAPTFSAPLPLLQIVAAFAQIVTGGKSPLHPVRVRKTAMPTHVIPEILTNSGFRFRFDFQSSLKDWAQRSPRDFV